MSRQMILAGCIGINILGLGGVDGADCHCCSGNKGCWSGWIIVVIIGCTVGNGHRHQGTHPKTQTQTLGIQPAPA